MEREALAQHHLVTTIKLGDADLRRVLKTMRDELQAPEVPVARRALQSFVERVEVNGDDVEIVYRPGVVLAASTGDKFVPPRGLENGSCDDADRVRPDIAGTWLALVAEPPSQVWTDRTREISKLREQGETLANIGQRFGLSAERVRQILLEEGQRILDPVGVQRAPDDSELAKTDSTILCELPQVP